MGLTTGGQASGAVHGTPDTGHGCRCKPLLAWRMLMLCERCGTWPVAIRFLMLTLLAKEDGGGRPVALMCSVQRVWEGAREPLFGEWDRRFARKYDYAGKGKAGHKAVWRSMLDDEAFDGTGIISTTVLTDLAKAYELVRLIMLWLLGVGTGMPMGGPS